MDFEIISGVIHRAQKVVVYGVEGVGKSTFASKFPDPIFIDTEGSTSKLNVKRLPKPTSYEMMNEEIRHVILHPDICKTLVIDTADWAEQYIVDYVLNKHQKKGIEDFGYGNGYVYVKEEVARFLHLLDEVINVGVNVLLLAHAQIRKFEQPDELGAYDRYELKLGKKTSSQTAPLVKEWADMVLFANYKTYSVAVDKDGKKHKAQGGQRVMYTTHHPCWDAKNRDGLPEELPFDYATIAHLFTSSPNVPVAQAVVNPTPQATDNAPYTVESVPMEDMLTSTQEPLKSGVQPVPTPAVSSLPKALQDLMNANLVTEDEIRAAVAKRGYYTKETPFSNYDPNFINGVLIGAWSQVLDIIKEIRQQDMQF
ncbi:ATP-binding protein [Beduini massiliensis]|uniref:ATP-binding protein n=1 Tax=Beduini massiliensis TaxID=1585974 RepID=UPI00059A940B|nr:ATP-binding protein [Beduini massiliensis]